MVVTFSLNYLFLFSSSLKIQTLTPIIPYVVSASALCWLAVNAESVLVPVHKSTAACNSVLSAKYLSGSGSGSDRLRLKGGFIQSGFARVMGWQLMFENGDFN